MKPTFVPALLTDSEVELLQACGRLSKLVSLIHIDFADNTLVPNQTVLPAEIDSLPPQAELHAHLMTDQPSAYFPKLHSLGFSGVVVHIESAEPMEDVFEQAEENHLLVAIAVNPETSLERVMIYKDRAQYIQLMGVHPGFGGQQFIEDTYDRLKELRSKLPTTTLAVDGGVRLTNAQQLIAAGASLLVVGQGGYQAEGVERWQQTMLTVTSPTN